MSQKLSYLANLANTIVPWVLRNFPENVAYSEKFSGKIWREAGKLSTEVGKNYKKRGETVQRDWKVFQADLKTIQTDWNVFQEG